MTEAEFDKLIASARALPPEPAVREVRAFFRSLPPGTAEALADSRPDQVGPLDGAPAQLRYRANRHRLQAARQRLRDAVETGAASSKQRRRLGTIDEMLAPVTAIDVDESGRLVAVQRDRQFLAVEPEGQGRVVEVLGDLDRARNVVVLVPGMGRTLDKLRDQVDWTHAIHTESGPDSAAVLWVDYDSPQGLVAASKHAAINGAPALRRFQAGLATETLPQASLTMIGHSYGSQVIGQSLRQGLRADRFVINGSPGIDPNVRRAADLVPPGTPVFTSRAPGDFVSYSEWHGVDPATYPDAVRMKTGGGVSVGWHEQYYRPNSESLRNVGRVVRGDLRAVTTTATSRAAETKLAPGVSWAGPLRTAAAAASVAYDGLPPLRGVKPAMDAPTRWTPGPGAGSPGVQSPTAPAPARPAPARPSPSGPSPSGPSPAGNSPAGPSRRPNRPEGPTR